MNPKDQSKDTLVGLAFTAEDSTDTDWDSQPKITIRQANQLLSERLSPLLTELEALRALRSEVEKAPQVSGYIHADGYILMDRPGNKFVENTYPSKPYTARLVCIEPIKEELKK